MCQKSYWRGDVMVMKREDQVVSEVLLEWRCDVHGGGRARLCQKSYWRGDVMFMKEWGACVRALLEWRCDGHEEGGPGCVRSPIGGEM